MSADTPQGCAAQMLRLLTAQRDLFAQVRDRAERQLALIDAGDTDALMRLLSDKQRLIAQNEKINADLEPVRPVWERLRGEVGPAVRQSIEKVLDETRAHLASVVEFEEQARQRAEGSRTETGAQVGKMQTGKAMLKAYGSRRPAAAAPPARFHDKNG